MGYIDADTHVIEDEHTWDFFQPGEEEFRPLMSDGYWAVVVRDAVQSGAAPPGTPTFADGLACARVMDALARSPR